MSVLVVIPTDLRADHEAELLLRCLVSLGTTAPEAEVLLVDNASPASWLVDGVEAVAAELGQTLVRLPERGGIADALNVGLLAATDAGQDALIVHPDLQFLDAGWFEAMLAATDAQGRPAGIVGGRLVSADGRIQHAGLYFSELRRSFGSRFEWAREDLPEALEPATCPVGGALQLIRHETLVRVGLYSDRSGRGEEHLDYCLRAFAAGLEVVYEPAATAVVIDSGFRARARIAQDFADVPTFSRLLSAHPTVDLGRFVPEAV